MRFDHVSAVYALFGQFYIGLRCPADKIGDVAGRGVAGAEKLGSERTRRLRFGAPKF